MAAGTATRIYPLTPGGAADGTQLVSGAVVLSDLTDRPRFGLKGAGSADWLAAQGVKLPAVNRMLDHRGMRVLRLGNEDILLLAEGSEKTLAEVKATWQAAPGPKGYSSWREEGWAWMRLSGARLADAMSELCALDLRPRKFGGGDIAQTRVGHIEAVTFRSPAGFDILFDITASAYFARAVATVAGHTDQNRGHS